MISGSDWNAAVIGLRGCNGDLLGWLRECGEIDRGSSLIFERFPRYRRARHRSGPAIDRVFHCMTAPPSLVGKAGVSKKAVARAIMWPCTKKWTHKKELVLLPWATFACKVIDLSEVLRPRGTCRRCGCVRDNSAFGALRSATFSAL